MNYCQKPKTKQISHAKLCKAFVFYFDWTKRNPFGKSFERVSEISYFSKAALVILNWNSTHTKDISNGNLLMLAYKKCVCAWKISCDTDNHEALRISRSGKKTVFVAFIVCRERASERESAFRTCKWRDSLNVYMHNWVTFHFIRVAFYTHRIHFFFFFSFVLFRLWFSNVRCWDACTIRDVY